MSQATRCDRCKTYFSKDELRESSKEYTVNLSYSILNNANIPGVAFVSEDNDLCPDCTLKLKRFMECMEVEGEN